MKALKSNSVLCRSFVRNASNQATINGYLFLPTLRYPFGKPLPVGTIKPKTPAHEALKNLKQASSSGVHFSITGHMRGLDGPGSSLDLPEFQLRLTQPGVTGINELPSTLTVASGFESTVRIEPAADPEAIEYVATDYGLYNPHVNKGPVVLTPQGKCPKGMLDAPAYVLTNLFGLKGIRVTVEAIAPMALAGGMESSNVFLTSLLAAGSMLSGSNLSEADIFALAVKLENDEFSGLTGGQGHLCCLLGGAHRHVWLSGVCDSYAAFSHTVLPESSLLDLEKHIMLVQAGKEYLNGKAVTARTAALTNNMWTDLLRDNDEVGLPLHKEKIGATATFTAALARKDFKTVVEVVQRYTEIRDLITCRWLTLAVDAHLGRQVPEHAKAYAKKSLGADDAEYKVVRDLYAIHKEGIKKISLYTLDPISTLVAKGRKEGVAIMPLGAGGPGANSIAISAEGDQHLRSFLHSNGLPELEPENVRKIITGTGLLKGYAPVVTGKHPLRYRGFDKIGLSPPSAPVKIVNETYQQLLSRLPGVKA